MSMLYKNAFRLVLLVWVVYFSDKIFAHCRSCVLGILGLYPAAIKRSTVPLTGEYQYADFLNFSHDYDSNGQFSPFQLLRTTFAILSVMVHLASTWKCRHIPSYLMLLTSPNFKHMDDDTITSAMIRLVMNICSFVAAQCPVGSGHWTVSNVREILFSFQKLNHGVVCDIESPHVCGEERMSRSYLLSTPDDGLVIIYMTAGSFYFFVLESPKNAGVQLPDKALIWCLTYENAADNLAAYIYGYKRHHKSASSFNVLSLSIDSGVR